MTRSGSFFLAWVLGLAVTAGLLVTLDGWPAAGREERAEEFQRLVGGLGFGPVLDLSDCEFGFDPRLCPVCTADCGPIPAGLWYCPHHACSTFDYPPLSPRRDGAAQPDDVLP